MAEVELPALTPQQKELSDIFVARVRASIERDGAIPFSEFMQRSLYEPGLGYYVNGFSKLGVHGDFITAPEISEHFAVCLAAQCMQVFEAIGTAHILEFGGGSGQLAVDLLKTLLQKRHLPESYQILEVSPDLQQEQRQLIERELPAEAAGKVAWLDRLPEKFNGVVVANEVLDAFAVERFTLVQGLPKRIMVGISKTGFDVYPESDDQVAENVSAIEQDCDRAFTDGFTSEYCTLIAPWWQALAECMETGAAIVCDYGSDRRQYYSPKQPAGTLRCFFRHTLHDDPFARAAVQDITADVDFTSVTMAATGAGMELQGYSPLSEFMLSLDVLDHHQQKLQTLDEREQLVATGQLKRVILSQEMGDRFMVIGFSKGLDLPLRGFSRADWSRLL